MSTQINQYLILGTRLDYNSDYEVFEDYEDNAFDNKINPKNGLHCLYDGMDGDYIYIGKCLGKSANHEFFDTQELDTIELSDKLLVRDLLKKHFDLECEIKLYFVTHYR